MYTSRSLEGEKKESSSISKKHSGLTVCFDYRSPAWLQMAAAGLNFVRKNLANQPICPLPPSPWASVFQLTAHVSHGSDSGGQEHPSESGVAGSRHLELRGDMFLMSSTLLTAKDGQTAMSWAPLFMLSLPAFIKALWLGCSDDGLINVGMGETDGSPSLKQGSSAGLWSQRRRDKKKNPLNSVCLTSPERCGFCEPLRSVFFFRFWLVSWKIEKVPLTDGCFSSQRIKTQPGGGTWGRKTVGEESLSSLSELTALLLAYPTVNHLDLGHYKSPFYYTFCLDQSISHHYFAFFNIAFFKKPITAFIIDFKQPTNLVSPLITRANTRLGYVQNIQYFC